MDAEQQSAAQTPSGVTGQAGGLSDLIANRPYSDIRSGADVTPQALGEAAPVSAAAAADPAATAQAGAQPQTPTPPVQAQVSQPQGVTTPQPDPFAAERIRYESVIRGQQQQLETTGRQLSSLAVSQLQAEDNAFRADLEARVENGDLTPAQAIAQAQARERGRAQQLATALYEDRRSRAEAQRQATEAATKNLVVTMTIEELGLPPESRHYLSEAVDEADLDARVANLQRMLGQQPPARQPQYTPEAQLALQRQQVLAASGALAAGGEDAGTPPPAPPKERSGDLLGLIHATNYQRGSLSE